MKVQRVDLNDTTGQLAKSFRETGFAVITNHGIDAKLLQQVYEEWTAFFSWPEAEKLKFLYTKEEQAGWFPPKSETAKGYSAPDLKEFYHFYTWFENNRKGIPSTEKLFAQLQLLAKTLLEQLEKHTPVEITSKLSEPLSSMVENSPQTLMRILHYPPLTKKQISAKNGPVRAAAHEDINMITLLPAATAPGLQVKDKDGNWHDVECDPNDIIVNAGDMLQEATQGYYPSTTHRVITANEEIGSVSRYSMPLFLHARPEVRLSERYTMREYLDERLRELGLK